MGPFQILALVVGWIFAIGLGTLWLVILYMIITNRINLQALISEPNGGASMSRFQFLIFTFVIAMSLFLITVNQSTPTFPTIPPEILGLMGISGGSYVISKGIQTNLEIGMKHEENMAAAAAAAAAAGNLNAQKPLM